MAMPAAMNTARCVKAGSMTSAARARNQPESRSRHPISFNESPELNVWVCRAVRDSNFEIQSIDNFCTFQI
jgi:hypothetical protein